MSRLYYGIEDLGLSASQRANLVAILQQLGDNNHSQPNYRNHWRIRLDNLAVIFEANFADEDWTEVSLKTRLAGVMGIAPALVTISTASTFYGPTVTFTRTTARLRMIAFGGLLASWEASHQAVLAYLKANQAAWDLP